MKPILYDISSAWAAKPEEPEAIGSKFLQTIDAIQAIEPSFADWTTCGPVPYEDKRPIVLASLRPTIGAFVRDNVMADDFGAPTGEDGYDVFAVSGLEPKSRAASFIVKAGSAFKNVYAFEVGSNFNPPDPSIITFQLYKAVLLTTISIWPAPWANAQCALWGERPPTLPGEPSFPYSGYQMPWISYLSEERAAKVDVPPSIQTERTPDGGLLMVATEARFDPTNVDHMRPSRLIAQIMIEHGGNPDY